MKFDNYTDDELARRIGAMREQKDALVKELRELVAEYDRRLEKKEIEARFPRAAMVIKPPSIESREAFGKM